MFYDFSNGTLQIAKDTTITQTGAVIYLQTKTDFNLPKPKKKENITKTILIQFHCTMNRVFLT